MILVVLMVAGMLPVEQMASVNAANSQLIYLDLSDLAQTDRERWTKPGVHASDSSGNVLNSNFSMTKVSDTLYSAYISDSARKVIFTPKTDWDNGETDQVVIADAGANPPTSYPMYRVTSYQSGSKQCWKGNWSTYTTTSGDDTVTTETFMVSTELWDYFNNTRVSNSSDTGKSYVSTNEGGATNYNCAPYSAWNFVIAGKTTDNTTERPTIPLYFGGLGHQSNRIMQDSSWTEHGLPNFSLTANVALSDYGNAAAQNIVATQLKNGNLADPTTGNELPYFKTQSLSNGNNQVSAYYSDLQFPFKKTTSENGQTIYSYDSAEDYAVYYSYTNKQLYKSYTYSYNTTVVNGENEKGYYPFDEANGYNPGSGTSYNSDAANSRNMGFGTRFTIPFTLSMDENRKINGQDVVFNFTGDDDVWVFIDDVLVLDMGGAHYKASGEINFTNQTVTVQQAYGATSTTTWTNKEITGDTWDQASSETAGVSVSKDVDAFASIKGVFSGETVEKSLADLFPADDTKVHTLTFFYMERGMYDSNMSISFTFNPVPSGLIVSKAVNTANVNEGLASTVQTKDLFNFTITEFTDNKENPVGEINYKKEYDGAGGVSAKTTEAGEIIGLADNIYAYDFTDSSGDSAFALGDIIKVEETGVDSEKYSTSVFVWDQTNSKMVTLSDGSTSGTTSAKFQLGEADSDNPNKPGVDYVVNFTNTPYVGSVSLTKEWSKGTAPKDTTFEFEVLVDLDGKEDYKAYQLKYTSDNATPNDSSDDVTGTLSDEGKLQLASGETVTFEGIPTGAKVQATETQTTGDGWEVDGSEVADVTVATGEKAEIVIKNKSKEKSLDKVIYVEAGKEDGTDYTVTDPEDKSTITVETATPKDEENPDDKITVNVNEDGSLNVDPTTPNETYVVDYTGKAEDSTIVNGKITIHTYDMSDDVYVFDYGLESDLADTTYDNGLFQNDNLYIEDVETIAKFSALSTVDMKQGTITVKNNEKTVEDVSAIALQQIKTKENGATISYSGAKLASDAMKVLYTPIEFMDQQENASYGTTILAPDNTDGVVTTPEDGVVMSATITVMPADIVYYEDNFASSGTENANGTNGIIYCGTTSTDKKGNEVGEQSNSLDIQYGYDDAYANGGDGYSNGSATKMGDTARALFEFTGTGFDIISRTTTNTGDIVVNIYQKEKNGVTANIVSKTDSDENKIYYVDNVSNLCAVLSVNTYYENGDLYQIPVISKTDLAYGTYIVEIVASFPTNYEANAVYIDGIRIYNPMGDQSTKVNGEDAYIAGEKDADIKEVRSLILGEGFEFNYEDPASSVEGEEPVATLIQYSTDEEGAIYLLQGKTVVESFSGEFVTAKGADADITSDLMTYAVNGPNNELYIENGYALGFDITPEDEKDLVLQIGVKKIQGTQPKLKYLNSDEEWVEIATIESATELYYDLTKIDDLYCGSQVILTVEGEGAIISFTNLKVNGYELTGLTPEIPESDGIMENAELNANTVKVKSGYSSSKGFTAGKYSTITFKTITDVESIKIVVKDAELVNGQPVSKTDSMPVVTASYKDSNGVRTWTVKFKVDAEENVPNFSIVCYDMYGNYSEPVNLK